MPSELAALLVDDGARARCEPVPAEKRSVVIAREEARLLALGALRRGETRARRLAARRLLVLVAEREPDALEVLGVDPREHVRLVLALVGPAVQQQAAAMLRDARVVPSGEPCAAGAAREREQLCETKAAVAADTRIRRLAARIAA